MTGGMFYSYKVGSSAVFGVNYFLIYGCVLVRVVRLICYNSMRRSYNSDCLELSFICFCKYDVSVVFQGNFCFEII